MRIPLMVRIGGLVIATTAFYGYVGQMVPQKEVQPPKETALGGNMTSAEMVKVGREIMEGKGICLTCHTIGKTGALRFPDLGGIGAQAKNRVPGLSDVEYLTQSLYEPFAFVVPGFPPAMPPVNMPPIGLNDQEILCVIAALQTLGGTPTVTLQTKHKYNSGAKPAPSTTPSPGEPQPLTPKKGAQLRPGGFLQPIAVHHPTARHDGARLAAAREGDQPPLNLRRSAAALAKAEGGVVR